MQYDFVITLRLPGCAVLHAEISFQLRGISECEVQAGIYCFL